MTSNKEDYLKAIYDEGGLQNAVPNKTLSDKLGISPASVSEMLAKLKEQGLIDYKPYKGSKLTEAGLYACIDVVRSHRLWEVFLMRHLGYTWREAHEDAHLMEHMAPKRMVDRMDSFLNFPQTCPHGNRIPHNGSSEENACLEKLSDLDVGETAIVTRVIEDGELLDYLENAGLEIGRRLCIRAIDVYEGPITFDQEGKTISISYKAATKIFVKRQI